MQQNSSQGDFTQGSILQKLLRFMVPVLGALILQAMYGAVDILVVGKFGTTAGISGVSTGCVVGVFIGALSYFRGDLLSVAFASDAEVILRSAEYLKGFALEAVVTSVLFSFIGYFNGHSQTVFVMIQGLAQTFLVRLPMSYLMSIQPDASLTMIGLAAPSATVFGILINVAYFLWYTRRHTDSLKGDLRK